MAGPRAASLFLATFAIVLVAVVVLARVQLDRDRAAGPRLAASAASGRLSLANSRAGSAIFATDRMGPGDSIDGSVTISNTGSLPAGLSLSQSELVDIPGPNGGVLSARLELVIADVTRGRAPAVVYRGKLGAMPRLALGRLDPREARTYRFVVSLPDGGTPPTQTTGDNAFVGSSTTARYDWAAVKAPPTRRRGRAARLRLSVPRMQPVLSRRGLTLYARCLRPCRLVAYGKLVRRGSGASRLRARLHGRRWTRLRLPLTPTTLARIRHALRRDGAIALRLTVTARERRGPTTVVRRLVVFKLSARGATAALRVR